MANWYFLDIKNNRISSFAATSVKEAGIKM